jgi:hypothetical protein
MSQNRGETKVFTEEAAQCALACSLYDTIVYYNLDITFFRSPSEPYIARIGDTPQVKLYRRKQQGGTVLFTMTHELLSNDPPDVLVASLCKLKRDFAVKFFSVNRSESLVHDAIVSFFPNIEYLPPAKALTVRTELRSPDITHHLCQQNWKSSLIENLSTEIAQLESVFMKIGISLCESEFAPGYQLFTATKTRSQTTQNFAWGICHVKSRDGIPMMEHAHKSASLGHLMEWIRQSWSVLYTLQFEETHLEVTTTVPTEREAAALLKVVLRSSSPIHLPHKVVRALQEYPATVQVQLLACYLLLAMARQCMGSVVLHSNMAITESTLTQISAWPSPQRRQVCSVWRVVAVALAALVVCIGFVYQKYI